MNPENPRMNAIRLVNDRSPIKFEYQEGSSLITDYYGKHTFGLKAMKEKLPKQAYQDIIKTIREGKTLDAKTADVIANAVREWAAEQGVTHFCHWFQPQTGSTAEKHDSFLSFDENQDPIESLTGSQLIQSEPDASSFPSGGMRTTFEARGYTAWDPSSPMFIMESTNSKTLCVPSAFISYHGDALDKKTGLLRSIEALSEKASELLHLIGEKNVKKVVPTLGCEQEYFLVDQAFFGLRPDLVIAGRTLLGEQVIRGQKLEEYYFGSIPPRVQAFMEEVEYELYRVGVPVKTRHNEVAPGQYEMAPIFEEANVAVDHNQLMMAMIKRVSKKHNFTAILHEKPFAGLNGSGKHCNWSLMISGSEGTSQHPNLLEPGKTPSHNMRFLLFLVSVLKGVHQHSGLLRAGISSAGNDHRLGANEAPPAIISVFLGTLLDQILNQIASGNVSTDNPEETFIKLGVGKIPPVIKDNTDRNRTSPFAFTGNKFEFRAVGSSSSPALPVTFLNAAVADGISYVTSLLKEKLDSGQSLEGAGLEVLKQVVSETKAIRFEGNNYSDDWVKEAQKRGLHNLRKTPEALKQIVTAESIKLFKDLNIFSEQEAVSRYSIRLERYIKTVVIEAETILSLVNTVVLPAALEYRSQLIQTSYYASQSSLDCETEKKTVKLIGELTSKLMKENEKLSDSLGKVEQTHDEPKKADMLASEIHESMELVRSVCDKLESVLPDELWPLPKYWEMLFLSK